MKPIVSTNKEKYANIKANEELYILEDDFTQIELVSIIYHITWYSIAGIRGERLVLSEVLEVAARLTDSQSTLLVNL